MNKESLVKQFNSLVDEFVKKMIKTFPKETKLKIWYVHFQTAKRLNLKAPVEYVMPSMINLGVPIMKKDDAFFKKNEYIDKAESFSEKTGLVNIWDSISDQVKDAIWGYIQSIFVLGMNTLGEEEKLKEVLTTINLGN